MFLSILVIGFFVVFGQDGDTALHKAAKRGHIEVVVLLLEHGVSANVQNNVSVNRLEQDQSSKVHLDV